MDIVNRFVDWVYCSVPVCSNLSVLGNCCYPCGGLSVACLVTFWPPIDRQSVSGALLHEYPDFRCGRSLDLILCREKVRCRKSIVAHGFSECSHKEGCAPEVVGDLLELSATFSPFCVIFSVN